MNIRNSFSRIGSFMYKIVSLPVGLLKYIGVGILTILKFIFYVFKSFLNYFLIGLAIPVRYIFKFLFYEIYGFGFFIWSVVKFLYRFVFYALYGLGEAIRLVFVLLYKLANNFVTGFTLVFNFTYKAIDKNVGLLFYNFILYIGKGVFIVFYKLLAISFYKLIMYQGYGIIVTLKLLFFESFVFIGKSAYQGFYSLVGRKGDAEGALGESVRNIPKQLKEKLVAAYRNMSIIKYFRDKNALNGPALLIDFESEEATKKSEKMITYAYVARDDDGNVIKGTFDAFSKVDVHSYLLSEGYDVYQIKESVIAKYFGGLISTKNYKIKKKTLPFLLTQLATYIKAGIPLVEALKILVRQVKGNKPKKVFKTLIYELTMGESFSEAMDKQGSAFPKLLTNMIKTAEMTGDLAGTLENMAEYYDAIEKTRKQMISALMYPILVFCFAIATTVFLLLYVVPSFVSMFEDMGTELPGITVFMINASTFLTDNIIWLLLGVAGLIGLFSYLFKKVQVFRLVMQWIFMHVPVIGTVIKYNEVTMFTKTFASLLNHNVLINESMEILNKVTNNEIYKMLIVGTIANLARGDRISDAFKNQWAFPSIAYEMLVTGERTGELGTMMDKVANYYQEQHRLAVAQIKSFIEPVIIVFLAGVVGTVVLSVVIPMFTMYDNF